MSQISVINLAIESALKQMPDIPENRSDINREYKYPILDGILADQADEVFTTEFFMNGPIKDIDLFGVENNAFDELVNFTKIKAIIVQAGVEPIVIRAATVEGFITPWTGSEGGNAINAGGCVALIAPHAAGFQVVGGSEDKLEIINPTAKPSTINFIFIGVKN